VRLWDLEKGQSSRAPESHTDRVTSVSVTPDGRRAVSGSEDETLRVWNAETGQCLFVLKGHHCQVQSVSVSADGLRAVSASVEKSSWTSDEDPSELKWCNLLVWDLETGRCLRELRGYEGAVARVCLTPDGRKAVSSGHDDPTMFVWDVGTGQCLHALEGHTLAVTTVSIAGDGRWAVSGSMDKTLRVWDLETGQCLRTVKEVGSVSVMPDGRRAVSASTIRGGQATLRVWDLETGQCLRTIKEFGMVRMMPDGVRAVSGTGTETLRVWDLDTGHCVAAVRLNALCTAIDTRSPNRIVAGTLAGEILFYEIRDLNINPPSQTQHEPILNPPRITSRPV
jgi:WD40 repeat protein